MHEIVVIVGKHETVGADLGAFLGRQPRSVMAVSDAAELAARSAGQRSAVVLFLRPTSGAPALLDALTDFARAGSVERLCLVSTHRVHFGNAAACAAETHTVERFRALNVPTVVFRPAPILSPQSGISAWLRRLAFCHPLLPRRLTGCCVDGDALFTAIAKELNRPQPRHRATFTLLGPNRPWCDVLRQHQPPGIVPSALALAAWLLSWLLIGHALALLVRVVSRWSVRLRSWSFHTLTPTTTADLLALINPYNHRHVKVVGYNNGVVHFGQHYPERTIVSTVGCNRVARVRGRLAKFDAGATVRQGIDALRAVGKEFYVVPNYSYVSLGTAFFIPIHGSAAEFSTMGDTIDKVLLYDPQEDRFVVARRGTARFQDYIYNLERPVLVLRVYFRVKDKSLYYLKKARLEQPSGAAVLEVFRDPQPSNVEIRKACAADTAIDVYRYYTQAATSNGDALPFPKDAIGRVWDRIETNPISSFLFHASFRNLMHHVELFFRADEFEVFWRTHTTQPILKIQVRSIKRDGLPHSPFATHDCLSVDLVMWRRHKASFEAYLKETFRAVQHNPGKHSA